MFGPFEDKVALTSASQKGKKTSKGKVKETVGQVQAQFILELERAKGKIQLQGMSELMGSTTQQDGSNVKSLMDKFICKHLNKKHCAKFMCKSCYH